MEPEDCSPSAHNRIDNLRWIPCHCNAGVLCSEPIELGPQVQIRVLAWLLHTCSTDLWLPNTRGESFLQAGWLWHVLQSWQERLLIC